jgi:hypothetical protein
MQDLGAEADRWRTVAESRGPGWRVWRWEEWEGDRIVWHHRLLAPDEVPEGPGDILQS